MKLAPLAMNGAMLLGGLCVVGLSPGVEGAAGMLGVCRHPRTYVRWELVI